jgi:3-oxoacyl-[acyl-carrier protein] reductase
MRDSVVLITGTRKGIGRYLAEHYVQRGARVVGCSRSEPEWSLENYTHFCADVVDEAAVRKMVAAVNKQFGRLDVLINNAGIASMNHVLLTPAATAERIFATNFQGVFLLCREAAKVMQRRRYGRIVNVSTVAVPLHLEGEALYAASKSAVVTFTQILAREVASYGITANVVAPTPIETDLIRAVPKEKIDAIVERLAIKRLGRFEDVANVIDFFVRPESDYITGQVITLGGVG